MQRRLIALAGVCALVLTFGIVALAAAQQPASVAGTWELSMEGRRGTMTQTLTIKQDGGKISGTVKSRFGESSFEGTIAGDKISFTVKRQTPRGEFTQAYKGTVNGDSMKGTVSMMQREINWTAKRQK